MIRSKFNKQLIGYIFGATLPLVAIVVQFLALYNGTKFWAFLEIAWIRGSLASIFSLALIPNMLIFFIFIWLNKLKSAQGVLGATIILAFAVMIIKFASG